MKVFLGMITVLALASCSTKAKEEIVRAETTQPAPIVSDLPAMEVRLLDGKIIDLKSIVGKTVLILFQPDCDHCQQEAEEIKQNLNDFKRHKLYFISSSPAEQIEKFSKDYKLEGNESVMFGWTTTENILNNFGPIAAPSIYIYSEKGKLVQKFNGQTPVEEIKKYL